MAKGLTSVLLVVALAAAAHPITAAGYRTQANLTDELEVASATPIPQYTVNIKHILCARPDFASLQGVVTKFGATYNEIKRQGLRWANEYNCRLCDVTLFQGQMDDPTVECSVSTGWVSSGNEDQACFQGNGKTGFRGSRASRICLPCPSPCASCEKPGLTDATYMTSRWFKCVLPLAPNGGSTDLRVPAPWVCEEPEHRSRHPGTSQWCNYRKDLSTSVPDEMVPSGTGRWDLRVTAAPCGGHAEPEDPADVVKSVMLAVASQRQEAYAGNCQICRISAGSPTGIGVPTSFERKKSDSKPWAEAVCAYDEIGKAACRTDRGQTGWNNQHGCNPCPLECASCYDDSGWVTSAGFNCKLFPATTAEEQLEQMLSTGGSANEDQIPATPAGYTCNAPEHRKCTGGEGMCMGYKTWCKYRIWD